MARGWSLPELAEPGQAFGASVWPYWLDGDSAVASTVRLCEGGAIATGPNMSGKSTLMRSLAAAALLTNCGFMSPAHGSVPHYRQIFFLAAEGDRPSEGLSAFGQEASLSGALLKRACDQTLALIDEFGRGTEPGAAQAAVGALVEELAARGTQFVVATHLHGVVDAALALPEGRSPPALWRMGVAAPLAGGGLDGAGSPRWTYTLEDGVCRDSFAWLTLRRFGWSKQAVERFHRLLARTETAAEAAQAQDEASLRRAEVAALSKGEAAEARPEQEEAAVSEAGDAGGLVVEELCRLVGCEEDKVTRLRAPFLPPAPFCESAAMLYVLCLKGGAFYVGQSDHLQKRLSQHRRSHGARLREVLVVRGGDTARSRLLEAELQQRLLRSGVDLLSWHDSANTHFGLGPRGAGAGTVAGAGASAGAAADAAGGGAAASGVAAGRVDTLGPELAGPVAAEVARLRRTAQELLETADRLEGMASEGPGNAPPRSGDH